LQEKKKHAASNATKKLNRQRPKKREQQSNLLLKPLARAKNTLTMLPNPNLERMAELGKKGEQPKKSLADIQTIGLQI
jgi:hypothetical protein